MSIDRREFMTLSAAALAAVKLDLTGLQIGGGDLPIVFVPELSAARDSMAIKTNTPRGGTFTMTCNGKRTRPLAVDCSQAELDETLREIGAADYIGQILLA